MDTSAISSLTNLYPTQKTSGISAPANIERDGDNDGSRVSGSGGGHHHGGSAFMQDVIQSLQSLGLNFPGANANNGNTVQSTSSSSSSTVGRSLHTFLHNLHQALNQGSAQQQSSSSDVQIGYNNFTTNLQSLIGSLSNGSSSNNSTLQTDFSNLVNTLGGSTSTSTPTPTLQDFLKLMESNTSNSSLPQNGLGSILKTQA